MSGLTFQSWVRSGAQLDETAPDPLSGPLPSHGALTFGIRLNQRAEVSLPARLYGPGDVTGLDPRQVIRTDPAPGADAAEPTSFPLVEFDRPELPWLLTPAKARDGERLRPWLVLVVAEASVAKVGPEPDALLPVLRCPRGELPDLADSWAWAHSQLVTDGVLDTDTLDRLVAHSPARSLSRLLCPRRLRADTRYVACVVPAFAAGVKRGRGIPLTSEDEAQLAPAWGSEAPSEEVALPAYHSWSFGTGPEGDFEALVRRLRARQMPPTLGLRHMDVSHPAAGFPAIDPEDPAAVLGLEGALRGPATIPSAWEPDAAASFAQALTPLLRRRPGRLRPPLYGGVQAGVGDVIGAPSWLRELNLDPRHRAAAAYGAQVVRRNEEELVASAWAQAAAVARANEELRQGQLARTAGERTHARRMGEAGALDASRLLQVTAPAHRALSVTAPLGGNREVRAAVSPAYRRLTRPGGPLARRVAPGTRLAPGVEDLADRRLTVNPPLKPAPGMVALEDLTGGDRVRDLTATRVRPRWWESPPVGTGEQPAPAAPRVLRVGAAMPNRIFVVTEDGRVMSRVDSPAAWNDHGPPPNGSADSQPVAIRDLHAFVVTRDGRLCSLGWDGDRWSWQDHGRPSGQGITGRPLALARGSIPLPGGLARSGNYQSVYVCAANGHVYALSGFDDDWYWSDLGAPPGAGARGAVGNAGPWELFVHGTDGRLRRFAFNGSSWLWYPYSVPPVAIDPSVPAVGPTNLPIVRTTDGLIRARLPIIGELWVNYGAPEPVSHILGFDNGLWLASEATGRVFRGWTPPGTSGTTWEVHDALPALRGWGALRGGEAWMPSDGRICVRRMTPGAYHWDDFGRPAPGGAGAPGAPAPRRPAWRGTLGFMSNLLVAHVDNPGGGNAAYVRIGRDLGFDAEVRGGWEIKPGVGGMAAETQEAGLALADLNGSGGQDVVLFWVEDTAQGNIGQYKIGWNIGPGGDVSWDPQIRRLPTPMGTLFGSSGGLTASYPIQACDVALGDLDADDRPEMVVAYVSGIPQRPRVYYRIGWRLDAAGNVAAGWSESIPVPWPGREFSAPVVQGVGVAVADVDNDLRPELIVLLLERLPGGLRASYMIGWQLNARGQVVGGWTGPHEVGGGPIGQDAQGAAVTLADFSGSQSPDLVVFHIENHPTDNTAWYRVGFDLQRSGLPRRWSEPRQVHPDGWWGWENQGAGIAVGDLDDTLLARKRQLAADFRSAAAAHQQLIERAQALARADDQARLSASSIASAVQASLDPDRTVTARVTGRIEGVDFSRLPTRADRLDPLVVAPSFRQAMVKPLAELSHDLLLPGIDTVPPDTLTLVRANPTFIEAYMAGLNHELARELLWRGFPADWRATYFRQFWDPSGGDPSRGPLTDIPPIAEWPADGGLGGHATAVGGPDMVVLLVRGELLRRYPDAEVYARRAAWGPAGPGTLRMLGDDTLRPQFRAALPPDLVFFGFPLTVAQARGAATDAGWFFVLGEHPAAPRFGVDAPPAVGATFGTAPGAWEDLDWARLAEDRNALDALRHAPAAAPFGTVTKPARTSSAGPQLTWPRNSAHLAHITLQRSVQVAVHAGDMLPDLGDGWRITGVVKRERGSPQVRIRAVGGTHPDGSRWRFSVAEAIEAIRRGERFYVEEPVGDRVRVLVAHAEGREYLRTEADGDEPNNLLRLPSLPDA
jgi:hypothetical protein